MTPLLKKLNFKNHEAICVLNAPDSFNSEMDQMVDFTTIHTSILTVKTVSFVIGFVLTKSDIAVILKTIEKKLDEDAVLWLCYIKGSSKKYKSEINRDKGWDLLGELGMEGVRQVAIDEDWSALRFRKVEHIKVMIRHKGMILSDEGTMKSIGN